jgi:ATP-dependent DNA helicase 2 subunit 2
VIETDATSQRQNEAFWAKFVSQVKTALVGTMDYALQECARPDVKMTKSVLLSTTLRFGNVEDENLREESISLAVRTSKATAITRPPTMKKFVRKEREPNRMDWEGDGGVRALEEFAPVNRRTDYYIQKRTEEGKAKAEPDIKAEEIDESDLQLAPLKLLDDSERVESEQLVRAYKYGATYIPFEEGTFLKLETKKGLDICGFMPASKVSELCHDIRSYSL